MPRFPELDSLVSAPLPYCRVILALGNGPELQGDITGLLPSGSVMAVKVTAATSKGEVLEEGEWIQVKEATEMMFGLDESKKKVRVVSLLDLSILRSGKTDQRDPLYRSWSMSNRGLVCWRLIFQPLSVLKLLLRSWESLVDYKDSIEFHIQTFTCVHFPPNPLGFLH